MTPTVGLCCDAAPAIGVGHLLRCLALAEELTARGVRVRLLGDVATVPWAATEVGRLGIARYPRPSTPAELVAAARRLRLDAAVLDSYELEPACAAALGDAGVPVLAVVDGDTRGQRAALYLDQNLDAELSDVALPAGSVRLAGLRYALLRDAVRTLRPPVPRRPRPGVPRVVSFFGGTDPRGAAPVLASLLAATGVPLVGTVVTANPALAERVAAVEVHAGQALVAVAATPDLPRLVADADLVVSAAGTSTWELLCLGVCPALVRVADNQRLGYDRALARGLAVGLGAIDELTGPQPARAGAVAALRTLLLEPAERVGIAARGWAAVDGTGRHRVADALLRVVAGARLCSRTGGLRRYRRSRSG